MSSRSAQLLTAGLSGLLVVLIGATIFVLLSRPAPGPTASPTPTAVSALTPSPSALPPTLLSLAPTPGLTPAPSAAPTPEVTFPPTPEITAEPTPTSSPTPTPSPTPVPTPTPTPTPTISPVAPQQVVEVRNFGLDTRGIEGQVPRVLYFDIDGPSEITATVSNLNFGRVQVCIWRFSENDDVTCDSVRNGGSLVKVAYDADAVWAARIIGHGSGQTATLTVRFNANSPSVTFQNFRYKGTSNPAYNGLQALVGATGTQMRIRGGFDGESYTYHLVVQTQGGDPVFEQSGGPAESFDFQVPVTPGTVYSFTLRSPDETTSEFAFVVPTVSFGSP